MSKENRKGYEFSKRDIDQAHNNWHKNNPGRQDEKLNAHHKVPIWFARENNLPAETIRSAQNLQMLPYDEHVQTHREMEEAGLWAIWNSLTTYVGGLFD